MKRLIAFTLVLFAFFSLACDPATPEVAGPSKESKYRMPSGLNKRMPPSKPLEKLGWIRFDGGKKEIMDEYKGKVLVLDFWATYCPPCIEGIPHLQKMKKEHGDDLEIIGLHVGGEEDRPRVPDFEKKLNIDYPIATPDDELTYFLLGEDSRIPQTVIFDRDGKKVKKFVSFDDDIAKEMDKVVSDTVNK